VSELNHFAVKATKFSNSKTQNPAAPVSSHFTSALPLSEGRAGEAWEPCDKRVFFLPSPLSAFRVFYDFPFSLTLLLFSFPPLSRLSTVLQLSVLHGSCTAVSMKGTVFRKNILPQSSGSKSKPGSELRYNPDSSKALSRTCFGRDTWASSLVLAQGRSLHTVTKLQGRSLQHFGRSRIDRFACL
jgi:hypothetical protein